MALVPQLAPYTYGFTAMEVVIMGRYPHMGRFQVEGVADREAAREAMELTRVEGFADREVTTLSGGERQRVFVARALAQQPRLLLLDEPTSNLDIQYQFQVMELVQGLTRQGLTAIAALHDLSLAAQYCDRLVLLRRGRVLAEGTPWDVLTPGNIDRAFGVKSLVYTDPLTGSVVVKVLSPSLDENAVEAEPAVVHVIGGGGGGSRAMYLLKQAGYTVTAGVLSDGDSDYHTARMLDVPCPSQPSFAPIGPALHQEHLRMVRRAQCVVLSDICFGEANLPNLEAAASATSLLLIEESSFDGRDYTGGRATELYANLRRAAKVTTTALLVDDVKRMLERAGPTAER
jgi:iron complex transport system ATP-binding protein